MLSTQPASKLLFKGITIKTTEIELVNEILGLFSTSSQSKVFKLSKESNFTSFSLSKPVEISHLSTESVRKYLDNVITFQNMRMDIRKFIRGYVNSNLIVLQSLLCCLAKQEDIFVQEVARLTKKLYTLTYCMDPYQKKSSALTLQFVEDDLIKPFGPHFRAMSGLCHQIIEVERRLDKKAEAIIMSRQKNQQGIFPSMDQQIAQNQVSREESLNSQKYLINKNCLFSIEVQNLVFDQTQKLAYKWSEKNKFFKFLKHLLATMSCNYLEFIVNWMEYGELVDPQREFFIYKTGSGGKNYSSNGTGLDNQNFETLANLKNQDGNDDLSSAKRRFQQNQSQIYTSNSLKIDWNMDYSVRYILERDNIKKENVQKQLVPEMFKDLTLLILEAGKSTLLSMYLKLSAMRMRSEGEGQKMKIIDEIKKNFFDLRDTYNFSAVKLNFEDLACLALPPSQECVLNSQGGMEEEQIGEIKNEEVENEPVEKLEDRENYRCRTFNQFISNKNLDETYSTSNQFNLYKNNLNKTTQALDSTPQLKDFFQTSKLDSLSTSTMLPSDATDSLLNFSAMNTSSEQNITTKLFLSSNTLNNPRCNLRLDQKQTAAQNLVKSRQEEDRDHFKRNTEQILNLIDLLSKESEKNDDLNTCENIVSIPFTSMFSQSMQKSLKKAAKLNNLTLQKLLKEKFSLKLIFEKIQKLFFLETFYYAEDNFFELLDMVEGSTLPKILEKFKQTFKEIIQTLDEKTISTKNRELNSDSYTRQEDQIEDTKLKSALFPHIFITQGNKKSLSPVLGEISDYNLMLTYKAPYPLQMFFSKPTMLKYHQIFIFLMYLQKVKRAVTEKL